MIDAIKAAVAEVAPRASVVKLSVDPVIGAVMSAMDQAGISIDTNVDAALRNINL
ncbi:hypothetical protein D3C87_2185130 [compost metagenome]